MAKRVYTSIVCLLGVFVFIFIILSRCKKDNTIPPVITLIGDTLITIGLGQTYVDQGATAYDKKDGNITNQIVVSGLDSINIGVNAAGQPVAVEAGQYIVGYHVEDASGNVAMEVIRKVHVKTDTLAGTYQITDHDSVYNTYNYKKSYRDTTYTIQVVQAGQADSTYNELLFIGLFKGEQNHDTIKAFVIHKYVTIPFQFFNVGNQTDSIAGDSGTYNGSQVGSNSFSLLTMKYSIEYNGSLHNIKSILKKLSKKSAIKSKIAIPKKKQFKKQPLMRSLINEPVFKGQGKTMLPVTNNH